MKSRQIELYQRVALTRDIPEHNLYKGDVAVVVEYLPGSAASGREDAYALEVFNAISETIAVVMVPASSVKPLTENDIIASMRDAMRRSSTTVQHGPGRAAREE